MNELHERRAPHEQAPEEFSPEYLAILVICGGSVRDSDWAVLPPALAARRSLDPVRQVAAGEASRSGIALR